MPADTASIKALKNEMKELRASVQATRTELKEAQGDVRVLIVANCDSITEMRRRV